MFYEKVDLKSAYMQSTVRSILKANIYSIPYDTHQLQLSKLYHFKLDRFKSI